MILRVRNAEDYDQQITLHTGEAKTVQAGLAVVINTGSDKRLASFYASLINYNFDVTVLNGSGEEINNFNDAVSRITKVNNIASNNKVLQDGKTYPDRQEPKGERVSTYNPQVLDEYKPSNNVPLDKVPYEPKNTNVPKVQVPVQKDGPVELFDSKLGIKIDDLTPQLPDDYPDDPNAAAEVARLEAQEAANNKEKELADKKYAMLDSLEEDKLKELLYNEFEENTRLRSKYKIIYHIIELADEDGRNVMELVNKYRG